MLWLIFGPLLGGLLLGLLQLIIYGVLKKIGAVEDIPFFGLLVFRGLIMLIAIAVITAIVLNYTDLGVKEAFAP